MSDQSLRAPRTHDSSMPLTAHARGPTLRLGPSEYATTRRPTDQAHASARTRARDPAPRAEKGAGARGTTPTLAPSGGADRPRAACGSNVCTRRRSHARRRNTRPTL